jgi:hypothetical protein
MVTFEFNYKTGNGQSWSGQIRFADNTLTSIRPTTNTAYLQHAGILALSCTHASAALIARHYNEIYRHSYGMACGSMDEDVERLSHMGTKYNISLKSWF